MTTLDANHERRLYRDRDRAILGGVCAGLAGYFGFNLKVTRILTFIAFCVATPIAVVSYIVAVLLMPSVSGLHPDLDEGSFFCCGRRSKRAAKRARDRASKLARDEDDAKPTAAQVINERCRSLDERLARLEKLVTSRRFQLEQELSRL